MNAKRLSHAACAHPSTKVARAKCRRELQRMVETVVAVASVAVAPTQPLMLMPAPIALTRTEFCSICSAEFETIAPESFDIDPVCHRHTLEEATDAPIVTRENWREFKGQSVTIVAKAFTVVAEITGWSANNLQYKTDEGKTVRRPLSMIVSVNA